MGAALAGGIGVGLYPGWSMGERMNPVEETIEPDPLEQAAYERLAPVFEAGVAECALGVAAAGEVEAEDGDVAGGECAGGFDEGAVGAFFFLAEGMDDEEAAADFAGGLMEDAEEGTGVALEVEEFFGGGHGVSRRDCLART